MARGLGRGLSSLIPEPKEQNNNTAENSSESIQEDEINYGSSKKPFISSGVNDRVVNVPIISVAKNTKQPRINFNEEKLQELAESIKKHGILQPLVVTAVDDGYELISGERRLQASKLANLDTVPVIVRKASEQEKLELALVENIQRADLNPIEEAKAYAKLEDEFSLKQEKIADQVGKSRSAVANSLRLLTLPEEIQKGLYDEIISEGHARAILGLKTDKERLDLFHKILAGGKMTVRDVEDAVKKVSVKSHTRQQKDPKLLDLEQNIQRQLGTKVEIKKRGGKGKVIIDFYSDEELNGIVGKISESDYDL
ncbi:MAG: ParB/RepB/Spo0J family partition protein [bacterium]